MAAPTTSAAAAPAENPACFSSAPPPPKRLRGGTIRTTRASDLRANSPTRRLTTGCPLLDEALRGGLRTRCLHEIVGESNCGKTQLCLQLLLTSQWSERDGGLGCRSLYVNTEGSGGVATTRLRELGNFHASKGFIPEDSALDNVFVERCNADDPTALLSVLLRSQTLLRLHNVRLIVVDSVANAFRGLSGAAEDAADQHRQTRMAEVLALLKSLAHRYDACVVLTNHVSDYIDRDPTHRALQTVTPSLVTSGRFVRPSLGHQVAAAVNTRYFVSRLQGLRLNESDYDTSGCVRALRVEFSPHQEERETKFIINSGGAWGIPEEVYRTGATSEYAPAGPGDA